MGRAGVLAAGLLLATPVCADTLRVATYNPELIRRGPGLLLADILDGDAHVMAAVQVIAATSPDILVLTGFDHDLRGHALTAFANRLADAGAPYPHLFTAPPNTGVPSGLDLDGNGYLEEPRDNWGYGTFSGQGGMAILSRYPIGAVTEFTDFLWADLPGAQSPVTPDGPFPSAEVAAQRRLSSIAHWDAPVSVGETTLHILAWHGSTPVFDGPEDLNGRRGADEALFWNAYLTGALPTSPPNRPVVLAGIANIDPADGDGRHSAIATLLTSPLLQDPAPQSSGGAAAANPGHQGDPALDTADFDDPTPGNLRVDYVLPDARLPVTNAGTYWPAPGDPMAETVATASRHRLVWVDIDLP